MKKFGLVLEGGGMRGVYTSGVEEWLLGQELHFPYVVGVSAGASNSCTYVARQKGRGKRVNLDYVKDWRYMGIRSLLFRGSYFGMEFLFGEIPQRLDPFDFDTFFNSPGTFRIGATSCVTGQAEYFDKHQMDSDLNLIKASCSLPLLSPIVKLNGAPYLDGGIADPIPVRKALADGCEQVVVVLTQPAEYRKSPPGSLGMKLYRNLLSAYPELVRSLERRHEVYNETLAYVDRLEREGRAVVIRPDGSVRLSRFEREPAVLGALFDQGYRDAEKAGDRIRSLFR